MQPSLILEIMAKQNKQFTELSDEDLKQVNGGKFGFPEECKDEQYMCSHPEVCKMFCASVS